MSGKNVCVLNLGKAYIIPNGVKLRSAGTACKIGNAGSGSIGAVLFGKGDYGCIVIGKGEIHLLKTFGGNGLTGYCHIHVAGFNSKHKGFPVKLYYFKLFAHAFCNKLCHHYIVTVSVIACVSDRDGAV